MSSLGLEPATLTIEAQTSTRLTNSQAVPGGPRWMAFELGEFSDYVDISKGSIPAEGELRSGDCVSATRAHLR